MSIKDLVPRFGRESAPARREDVDPFRDFRREMNRLFGEFFGDYPLAEAFYEQELSLPLYPDLTDEEVEKVIVAVTQCIKSV